MSQIAWKDSYKIGVDFIDKEHQLLFSTMNKLLKISENEEKSEWVCREGVKYLRNHTTEHFEHEENYMQSIQYGEYEVHKRLHDNFRYKTLPALETEMEMNCYSVESVRHFLGVCIGWVFSHTQTEDMAIVGKTASRWTVIPQNGEQEVLSMMIIQIFQEMFRLKAKMISEHYAGEDFGKVICCRLVYGGQQKEKWEVTFVFEERLLLKIISGVLNAEYSRVDDMAINVIRYISRQFLERIWESLPPVCPLELEKECLLTHEQLLGSFGRNQPDCSMLFSTGEGYFAFSVAAVHSARNKMEHPIDHQNAMKTIQEYLVKEEEEQAERKPRILVVDDSEFMRSRIMQLLVDRYDLIEADSSMSAIKKIVINRPDLVLLDYEMPVCDGRQALEMIRSDPDIADIPVMFLTGRGDMDSVKKVMALKPEGYLLKTMPDDQIKKSVDDFFEKKNG